MEFTDNGQPTTLEQYNQHLLEQYLDAQEEYNTEEEYEFNPYEFLDNLFDI